MAKPKLDSRVLELFETKLHSSGLTLEDAKLLRMTPLTPEATQRLHQAFRGLASFRLDYLDPHGQPLPDWPKSPPFYRVRYLEQGTDFASLAEKKPPRYVQEPGTAPCAYYPANQEWGDLLADPSQPLILTEGELKAAKACKEGFPTIGLGGVYNWRALKIGLEWVPSLDYVNWIRRNVYICFDSDMSTNSMVCHALRELAEMLSDRGAFVHVITLPQLEGLEKVGLDDFLVHSGPSAVEKLAELLHEAEPLGLTRTLFGFNDRYIYIRHPGLVLDRTTQEKVGPGPFKEHLEAAKRYQEQVIKPDGTISYKPVSAAGAWLKWPMRYEADKLTYKPGAERYLTNGINLYNIWPGWGVEPAPGDVTPFLKLVDHIFHGCEDAAKHWFLCWCAYPLQHPGVKLFTSVVVHGRRHGTGKSLIGYSLGAVYGKNFTEISQMDLHNAFNEWAEGKQFVLGDDVTGSNKRQDADYLKKLITQKELRVNAKYVPSYTVPDCVNYYFTSNQPDAFFLEDDDRRFFVHEVQVAPLPEEFYVEYDLWMATEGPAALFDYLLQYDTGDFNPAAPAFNTHAKERMIADGQSDLGAWVRQLIATPDHCLRVGEITVPRDLFTSKELLQFYDPTGHTGTTANGLGRELRRAGIHQVCHGRPVRTPDGAQGRYYIARNVEKWLTATSAEVAEHLTSQNQAQKTKKY